jgi:Domain of unknown function (DUF4136)
MAAPAMSGMRSTAAVVAAAVAWLAAAQLDAAKTDIKVEFDRKFSFAGLRTWAWHPDGAGDVRLAVSAEDDPKRVAARVDPVIVPAIEREMAARGFVRTAPPADMHVHYYVLATVKMWSQYQGQFVPSLPEWGLPPFAPQTTALAIYPVGTLIIDVTSPAAGAIVWRGAAQRTIDLERPDDERRKVLQQAIRTLIQRFPKK